MNTNLMRPELGVLNLLLQQGADPLVVTMFGKMAVELVGSVGMSMVWTTLPDGSSDVVDSKPVCINADFTIFFFFYFSTRGRFVSKGL